MFTVILTIFGARQENHFSDGSRQKIQIADGKIKKIKIMFTVILTVFGPSALTYDVKTFKF